MAYRSVEIARLHAQREALDKELAEARERESGRALREIVQKMREYGISLNELMGRKPKVEAAAESITGSTAESTGSTVKYRDPVSGSTWSGRGRAPGWIIGKDRNDFLVDERSASRAPVQPDLFSVGR